MKSNYNNAQFPPQNEWDNRLDGEVCKDLVPVQILHENAWFSVKDRAGYFTVEDPIKHVVVLPVIDEKYILMVRVKRPVLDDFPLEFPAGGFEHGESAYEAAARELHEETGIRVDQLERFLPMTPLAVSPNRVPRLAYVFRINLRGDEYISRSEHDHEVESLHQIHISEIPKIMNDGSVYVSVPLALLGMYLASTINCETSDLKF